MAAEADRLLARVLPGAGGAAAEGVAAAAARLLGKGAAGQASAEASRAFLAAAAAAAAAGRRPAAAAEAARPLIPIRPELLRMEPAESLLAVVTEDVAQRTAAMEDGWAGPSVALCLRASVSAASLRVLLRVCLRGD